MNKINKENKVSRNKTRKEGTRKYKQTSSLQNHFCIQTYKRTKRISFPGIKPKKTQFFCLSLQPHKYKEQLYREKSRYINIIFFPFVQRDFGYRDQYWPIVPAPDHRWWWLWGNWWNKDCQRKPKYSENLPQRRFAHHKAHMTRPRFEPEPPRWEASD
jgi:hypothetical protein